MELLENPDLEKSTHAIFSTISNIIKDSSAIAKNKKSSQNYNYRGIDDIYNAYQPLFAKHGLFIVPEVLEHTREERATTKGTSLTYSILKIKYTFIALDGSSVSATVIGEGMDGGDKSSNKAMSVAMKYAMFQVFCIPTEEMQDPDAETPEPIKPKTYKCEVCGKEIESNIALKSKSKYGFIVCSAECRNVKQGG